VAFVEREMKSLGLDENLVGLEDMFGEIKTVSSQDLSYACPLTRHTIHPSVYQFGSAGDRPYLYRGFERAKQSAVLACETSEFQDHPRKASTMDTGYNSYDGSGR
jgi:hypothetical protein